jgi:hypothetical protein
MTPEYQPFHATQGSATFARMLLAAHTWVRRLATALVVLPLAVTACFVFNRGNNSVDESVANNVPESEIALNVTNHNYLDVVVYVLHDGQRTRVGTASGSSSSLFFLPPRLIGQGREIRLYGDAIGNDDYAVTDILVVQRGQYIEWTLETDLRRSSVGVF